MVLIHVVSHVILNLHLSHVTLPAFLRSVSLSVFGRNFNFISLRFWIYSNSRLESAVVRAMRTPLIPRGPINGPVLGI